MNETAAPPAAPRPQTLRLSQDGRVGELFPIVLVNVLLTVLTLGVYRFWAKTRVRAYLWSTTGLAGDRFEYTGRGLELFLGFLIVVVVVLLPLGLLGAAAQFMIESGNPAPGILIFVLLYPTVFFLIGIAIYRAQRYRLSRTRWRAIRPALTGNSSLYGLIYLATVFLNGATFGWAIPWSRIRLMQQMLSHSFFGDRPVRFEGGSGPLYRRFALYWCGSAAMLVVGVVIVMIAALTASDGGFDAAPPARQAATVAVAILMALATGLAVAVLYAFYKARELAYIAECTALEGLRFRFEATAGSLIGLALGNALIVVLSLGLGYPFVQLRNFRYLAARLSAEGEIDFDAIRQSAAAMPALGEGLADAFDVGNI